MRSMGMNKKQVLVTVKPELSPRIENWLIGRDIDYEVEIVKKRGGTVQLKIVASFSSDEGGKHQEEMYGRFLDRIEK